MTEKTVTEIFAPLKDADDRQDQLTRLHADAATVVRALDAAVQFIEVLVATLPANSPLPPNAGTVHAQFQEAMTALHRPAPSDNEEIVRLNNALKIACSNIASLSDERTKLSRLVTHALTLIDTMLNELARLPDLPISLVAARNQFKEAMKELLPKQGG